MKKPEDNSQYLNVAVFVILWFIGYFINTIVSKDVKEYNPNILELPISPFHEFKWVELTALQHLVGTILSVSLLFAMRKPIWQSEHNRVIVGAALCNMAGNLATNAAYTIVSSSTSRAIETTQPLTTFALAMIMFKENGSLTLSNFLSVLIIVLGVCGFILRDVPFTGWSCLMAVILTTFFALRNLLLKKVSHEWDNALQKFMMVSLLSALFVLPVWLLQLVYTHSLSTDKLSVISSFTHTFYNLASFNVLESIAAVMHAIVTIFVKASTYACVANFVNFQAPLSSTLLFSSFVVLVGIYLYWLKDGSSIQKIMSKLIFAFFVVLYLYVPKPAIYNRFISSSITQPSADVANDNLFNDGMPVMYFDINTPEVNGSCEQISTSWMYAKDIPEAVVSNIVTLASQNPSIPVHVYCGSEQCVDAVSKQKRSNMKVEFAVLSKILKGVSSSLEQWLARHPINKVLAGREFETHLQDVMVLGIFLKYGGIYVNPVLKLERDLGDVCQSVTPAWVFKNHSQLTGNIESVLDLSFFGRNHPFVHKLANLYASRYRKQRSTGFYQRSFLRTVWHSIRCINTSCPKVLKSVPAITSSDYSLIDGSLDSSSLKGSHFGLLSRSQSDSASSMDIEIQDFAGAYFLPFIDTYMDQATPNQSNNVTAFLSGLGRTEKWHPPRSVNPIMLGVHLQASTDRSTAKLEYLKGKEPVGCADSTTLSLLENNNVSAYLSGSLMLLLHNPDASEQQRQGVFLSRLSDDVISLLPSEVQKSGVREESSFRNGLASSNHFKRFKATYQLLEKYKSSSLVITSCYHCASSCAALGTPVIFVETMDSSSSLAAGMTSLFHTLDLHNKTSDQARTWLRDFPWKDIPPNPDLGFMMRLRATAWNVIRRNQVLFDTAKKLGVIPMSPPQISPKDRKILFHMIFTSSAKTTLSVFGSKNKQSGAFNWRHWRSIESVFRFHPTSDLILHSNTLSQDMFNVLTEVGYSLNVSSYKLEDLLKGSPASGFIPKLSSARKGLYWVYNEANLLRQLAVYKWGGVYLDTDIYLVRPLHTLRINGAGWQDKGNGTINNAFLYYEKEHPFVREVLQMFVRNYRGDVWGNNGPSLVTKVWSSWKRSHGTKDPHDMVPYNYALLYLIHYSKVKKECFDLTSGSTFDHIMSRVKHEVYGLHINAKITGDLGTSDNKKIKKGTLCSYLLNEFCVLCDTTY